MATASHVKRQDWLMVKPGILNRPNVATTSARLKHRDRPQLIVARGRLRVLRTRTFDSRDTRRPHHGQSTRPIRLQSRIVDMD